jgi:hypothetical protein
VLRAQDRFDEAIPEYELAIDSDRNWLDAYGNLAQCKFYEGGWRNIFHSLSKLSVSVPEIR